MLGTRSLFAEINSWQYTIGTDQTEEGTTGRHLLMIGETMEAHSLRASEINLEIVELNCFPRYKKIFDMNQRGTEYGGIVWHDYDSEYKIPRHVHGTVMVSENRFNHIFDLLLYKDQVDNSDVMIKLGLFGLKLGDYSIEDDKWPVDKMIAITDMELTLSKAMEKEKI